MQSETLCLQTATLMQPCVHSLQYASQESLRRYRKLQRKSKAASSASLLGAPTEEAGASSYGMFGLFSKGGEEEPSGGRRTKSVSAPKAHAGSGGERRERERERRPSRHEEGV